MPNAPVPREWPAPVPAPPQDDPFTQAELIALEIALMKAQVALLQAELGATTESDERERERVNVPGAIAAAIWP